LTLKEGSKDIGRKPFREKRQRLFETRSFKDLSITYELAWKTMRRYFKLNNQLEKKTFQIFFERQVGRS